MSSTSKGYNANSQKLFKVLELAFDCGVSGTDPDNPQPITTGEIHIPVNRTASIDLNNAVPVSQHDEYVAPNDIQPDYYTTVIENGTIPFSNYYGDPFDLLAIFPKNKITTDWTASPREIDAEFSIDENNLFNTYAWNYGLFDTSGTLNEQKDLYGSYMPRYKWELTQGGVLMEDFEYVIANHADNVVAMNTVAGVTESKGWSAWNPKLVNTKGETAAIPAPKVEVGILAAMQADLLIRNVEMEINTNRVSEKAVNYATDNHVAAGNLEVTFNISAKVLGSEPFSQRDVDILTRPFSDNYIKWSTSKSLPDSAFYEKLECTNMQLLSTEFSGIWDDESVTVDLSYKNHSSSLLSFEGRYDPSAIDITTGYF